MSNKRNFDQSLARKPKRKKIDALPDMRLLDRLNDYRQPIENLKIELKKRQLNGPGFQFNEKSGLVVQIYDAENPDLTGLPNKLKNGKRDTVTVTYEVMKKGQQEQTTKISASGAQNKTKSAASARV